LLVKEGLKSERIALICSALSIASYTVLIGIYAGLYANWLATIISCFLFYFLLKFVHTPNKLNLTIVGVLSIIIFQFHSYAGYYYLTIIVAFLSITFFTKRTISNKNLLLLGIIVLIAFGFNYYKTIIIEVPNSIEEIEWATNKVTVENFAERWETLGYVMYIREGGIFPNSIMIALAIFWAITINFRNNFERLLFSFIPILAIFFLFGNPVLQSRQLYVFPVMLFATLGGIKIMKLFRFSEKNQLIFLSLLFLFNSNYVLRTLMNLDLVLPEP